MEPKRRQHLEAQISAYLDDELSPEQRRDLERLLAEDHEARRLLAELRAISGALHDLPRARAGDDIMEAVRSRLERRALLGEVSAESTPPLVRRGWPLRWMAAATVVLVFFGSYAFWKSQRGGPIRQQFAFNTEQVPAKPESSPVAGEDRRLLTLAPETHGEVRKSPMTLARDSGVPALRGPRRAMEGVPGADWDEMAKVLDDAPAAQPAAPPMPAAVEAPAGGAGVAGSAGGFGVPSAAPTSEGGRVAEAETAAKGETLYAGVAVRKVAQPHPPTPQNVIVELNYSDPTARGRAMQIINSQVETGGTLALRNTPASQERYRAGLSSANAPLSQPVNQAQLYNQRAYVPPMTNRMLAKVGPMPAHVRLALPPGTSVDQAVEQLRNDTQPLNVAVHQEAAASFGQYYEKAKTQTEELVVTGYPNSEARRQIEMRAAAVDRAARGASNLADSRDSTAGDKLATSRTWDASEPADEVDGLFFGKATAPLQQASQPAMPAETPRSVFDSFIAAREEPAGVRGDRNDPAIPASQPAAGLEMKLGEPPGPNRPAVITSAPAAIPEDNVIRVELIPSPETQPGESVPEPATSAPASRPD